MSGIPSRPALSDSSVPLVVEKESTAKGKIILYNVSNYIMASYQTVTVSEKNVSMGGWVIDTDSQAVCSIAATVGQLELWWMLGAAWNPCLINAPQ